MRVYPTSDLAQLIGPAPFDIEPTAPDFPDFTPAATVLASVPAEHLLPADYYAPASAFEPATAAPTGRSVLAFILAFGGLLAFGALVFASLASLPPLPTEHAPKRTHRLTQHAAPIHLFALTSHR